MTRARWLGPSARPLLSWLTTPAGGCTTSGCIVLPPLGYEYWTAHRTLRTLAERLACAGHTVLRVDYDGTGDSAGDQWDDDRVAAWRSALLHAAEEIRTLGTTTLTVVGLRFGATLALFDAAAAGADEVVAWLPAESGRRYVKELRLLGTPVPPEASRPEESIIVAGSAFPGPALAELARLDVSALAEAPATRILLVERPDRPMNTTTPEHLESLGAQVDRLSRPGSELALDLPTEYATVPTEIVEGIVEWVGTASVGSALTDPPPQPSSTLTWLGTTLREDIVEIGPHALVGITTRPAAVHTGAPATVVFLNTGSEPHFGPGRAWVEYARTLAAAGHTTVRVDFRGWGESPDDGHAPGRPYDAHTIDDTVDIVQHLHAEGHTRIVLVGLCASAWVALRAVLREPVAGVVAINPQLYWEPGDPVEATMAETRKRRMQERRREHLGGTLGVWTALDAAGVRHPAARWLRALGSAPTAVLLLFAEGDDGIEFLENRVRRTFRHLRRADAIEAVEVPHIDHPMHRHWLRAEIVAAISAFLERV